MRERKKKLIHLKNKIDNVVKINMNKYKYIYMLFSKIFMFFRVFY